MKHLKFLITATLTLLIAPLGFAQIIISYHKVPLTIALDTEHERIIFIDKSMDIGVPQSLNNKLRVQSVRGAIYLRAFEPFAKTRLQLRDRQTGELMMLDVFANKGQDNATEHIRIEFAEEKERSIKGGGSKQVKSPVTAKIKTALPTPVALIRYASQQLYAPSHAIEPLTGVVKLSLKLPQDVAGILPGFHLKVTPLESFSLNGYSVTSFKVQNLSSSPVNLSVHQLQGRFHSAAFQHLSLSAYGTIEDTTALYLVVQGSIADALKGGLYGGK